MKKKKECECVNWCDADFAHRMLTGHHASCKNSPDALKRAKELIKELVKGIEAWGHEEDGIYEPVWEAYKKGKSVIGEFDWKEGAR